MRDAMATARVGDDVFGEDPTIAELESEAAAFLGKAAAMFVPSGTMANQIAIHVHCRPGDELICEERSHVYYYEGGSIARLSGTQVRTIRAPSGFPTPDDVRAAVRPDDPHFPRSRLLVVENTHNMAGGRCLAPDAMDALAVTARESGLIVHIDGARLANAAVAQDVPAARLAAAADTLSLCLSKGLGAPVGSVVAGSVPFIAEARRVRKAFGGGMRQAGVLAAAALIALRDGPGWLALDHERARRLAESAAGVPGLTAAVPDTNICMVDLTAGAPEDLIAHLRAHEVLALKVGPMRVRLVTHRDLSDEDVDRAVAAIRSFSAA
ncbi:MAG: GntG family PLP-dependent aldolase [Planctomycetota bacterium]|nr:GntG family PLP-dependent aldolase [Planctomycetota bacterium]